MAIPTTGAMIAAIASEWAAVSTSKLFWDDTNTRLGIGMTPTETLSVNGNILIGTSGKYFGSSRAGMVGYTGSAYPIVGYGFKPDGSSGWNYGVTDYASAIGFSSGGLQFYSAPSGTTGNAITFTERMRITQGGRVSIGGGVTTPAAMLQIATGGDAWTTSSWSRGIQLAVSNVIKWAVASSYVWGIGQSGGDLYFGKSTADDNSAGVTYCLQLVGADGHVNTTGGVVYSISDEKTKTKVRDFSQGLSALLGLSPALYQHDVNFVCPDGKKLSEKYPVSEEPFVGITAQDLRVIIPEAVSTMEDGMLTMTTGPLIYVLINAIKELNTRLEKLEEPE